MSPAIEVKGLSKRYRIGARQEPYKRLTETLVDTFSAPFKRLTRLGQTPPPEEILWALKDVSFTVQPGEVVGIIGRNGAGKSTLLKILSRITEPTAGEILLHGRVASLLEVGTGFRPELTGRENIFLNGAILGMSRTEIKSKFDEIVAFAEVDRFIDTPVKRYSSGMYVRLAFAVAAHLEPEILVVDEVLAVGDAAFQKKCLGKMSEVAEGGRTVLFVSHNMGAIERLCNTGILLNEGQISAQSSEVDKIILKYHGISAENDLCNEWKDSSGKFTNYEFSPNSLSLVDANNRLADSPTRKDADIFLQIKGTLNTSDPGFNIGYALYNEDDQLLFWTLQTDENQESWPNLEPGPITLLSKIPTEYLNEGIFRIELISSIHFKKWIFQPRKEGPQLFFEILGGLSESPLWLARRPGILAPIIPWQRV